MKSPVYEPREDSFLIVDAAKELVKGKILEIGIGSGYVSHELSKVKEVKSVLGIDINPDAVEYAKKNYSDKKIEYIESNLFEKVKGKFDFIICNPPYLPQDKGIYDPALYGGKRGYEYTEKMISQAEEYLEDNGSIILLFSSLTIKDQVERIIRENFFTNRQLTEKYVGTFETLYVDEIKKREELIQLKEKGVKNIKFFSKGKRGLIFTGNYQNTKVGIKIHNGNSDVDSMHIESNILNEVNQKGIGPKIIFDNPITYKFFEGMHIGEWTKKQEKKKITLMLIETFRQLKILDEMLIDKKEMSHPHKHILVDEQGNICLIDYERSRKDENPSNVTGFCQFITSSNYGQILKEKGIDINKKTIISLAKEYKTDYNTNTYNKIIQLIQ